MNFFPIVFQVHACGTRQAMYV